VEKIEGNMASFHINQITDLSDEDALKLIDLGLAEEISKPKDAKIFDAEHKMLEISYKQKQRGRPKKET
jgi:hypothetical protein